MSTEETCVVCHQPFTEANVFTADGWAEVKISRMCEAYLDAIFDDDIWADDEEEGK